MKDGLHVAICGNIGCGKTTLAEMLSKHFHWKAEMESVEDNPYLADFYEDMKRWSFHLQIYFLNSRFNQIKRIRDNKTSTIQDRTIFEDAYIFADNLRESGLMNERDYECYLTLFKSMIEHVQAPDLLIYLKADIPKLVSQIEKRGRSYENAIRLDYLMNLNSKYEKWITSYSGSKLITIDMNSTDFVHNHEDFAKIVNRIDVEINGLFS